MSECNFWIAAVSLQIHKQSCCVTGWNLYCVSIAFPSSCNYMHRKPPKFFAFVYIMYHARFKIARSEYVRLALFFAVSLVVLVMSSILLCLVMSSILLCLVMSSICETQREKAKLHPSVLSGFALCGGYGKDRLCLAFNCI